MFDMHEPKPGYWYINRTGKLIKVKMVMRGLGAIESVLLQYIEGSTYTISMDDWQCLDLVIPRYEATDVISEKDKAR